MKQIRSWALGMPLELRGLLIAALMLLASVEVWPAVVSAQENDRAVAVILRDKAVVNRRRVRLQDVAEISGGPEAARKHVAALEIDDMPTDGRSLSISRLQLQYCLRLAGLPQDSFTVAGAAEVVINSGFRVITPDEVYVAAKEEALRRLQWRQEDLAVRLAQPIAAPLPAAADDDSIAILVEPHKPNVTLGRTQMNVTIRINGQRRLALAVYLEIYLIEEVAVAKRSIRRGEPVTEADVFRERWPIAPNDPRVARADHVVGRTAKREIAAGSPIGSGDVDMIGTAANASVVQNGHTVRIVARLGTIDVIATGEALQSGGEGQIIRVKNTETKKVLTGRITGPKTVEIDLGNP